MQQFSVKKKFNLILQTKVVSVTAKDDALHVGFEGKKAPIGEVAYDVILVAVGQKPTANNMAGQPMLAHKDVYEGHSIHCICSS